MTEMSSRPIAQTVVYAQDTAPTDERDGVLWVDTSQATRPTFVWSSETQQWEPTFSKNHVNPLYDADEDGVVDNSDKLDGSHASAFMRNGDLGFESGSVSRTGDGSFTVSFSNTYSKASWGVSNHAADSPDAYTSWFNGWTTDGSGNITGMSVTHRFYSTANSHATYWTVVGEKA